MMLVTMVMIWTTEALKLQRVRPVPFQEIPQELYTAVAVVLSWVYWLRGMRPGDEKMTPPLEPSEAEGVKPLDSLVLD